MSNKNKKPVALHLLEGNTNGLTKDEIKERQQHEEKMKVDTDKVEPPSRLTKKQKGRFADLSSQLIKIEIFDNLDVDTLALYIETYDNYVKANGSAKRMTNKDIDNDFDSYAKKMRTVTQLADTCRKLASDLGLTITSRLKLTIPQDDEKEERTPMQKFMRKRDNHA